jgi:outer membrane cobalamin receptor
VLTLNAANSGTSFKGAVYGQIAQSFGPARIIAGVRLDYFDQIREKAVVAPRLSATYALSPFANVNASVGRYYQAPSYVWLFSNPSNRDLQHVGADHFIIGFDQLIRTDTRVSLEGYVKNYFQYPTSVTRPYLVLANTGAGFGGSEEGYASFGIDPLVSSGSGAARGVELLVQKKLSEVPCYGTVSISYTESEFTALDGVTRPSAYDQRWIVNVGGGYVFNEKWEVSTKFRFVTGRPYTPFGPGGIQDPAELYSQRVRPNHSLDVRVDRRWSFGTWTLVTYVDIQNIYNRKPLDVPRYNQREQRAVQESSIGILPSIGVSAEF